MRLVRRAHGFSRQQVASRAGISRQAVSAIESGVTDPPLRVAFALAQALDTTVGDLLGPGNLASQVAATPVVPPGGAGARVSAHHP